jgi:hypothetical protein
VKKLIGLGLLLVACRGSMTPSTTPTPVAPGAASPKEAVTRFLDAAKMGDLQAMSAVWGTPEGSIRDQMPRDTVEMREIYIAKCVRHDKFTIVSDEPGQTGTRVLTVQLVRGPLTRQSEFLEVQDQKGRWYVQKFQIEKLNDICMSR